MTNFSNIKNLPLLFLAEAEESGKIKGVLTDRKMNKIYYIVFVDKCFGTLCKRYCSLKKIAAFGRDAVAVENKSALADQSDLGEKEYSLTAPGAKIFNDRGEFLGRLTDFVFDETGKISEIVFGEESASQDKIASSSDGIIILGKKIAKSPKPKKIPLPKNGNGQKVFTLDTEPVSSAVPPRFVSDCSFLSGRTVLGNISDGNGNVIIPEGAVITDETVSVARKHFRLSDLTGLSKQNG